MPDKNQQGDRRNKDEKKSGDASRVTDKRKTDRMGQQDSDRKTSNETKGRTGGTHRSGNDEGGGGNR